MDTVKDPRPDEQEADDQVNERKVQNDRIYESEQAPSENQPTYQIQIAARINVPE